MSSHRSSTLLLIALSLVLGACSFSFQAGTSAGARRPARRAAQPTTRTTTPPKATATPASTSTPKPPTSATPEVPLIKGKNVFGNGTLGAFRGHAYVIPNTTTKMPDLGKMVPFAALLTDSFIVQPQEFTEGFPGVLMQDEWFAIRFEGNFQIPRDGSYAFALESDDGAIFYIDGEKVIDNDGLHATKTVKAIKPLKAGRHALRLDYFQGNRGPVSLSLTIVDNALDARALPLVGIR
jgi:hypothetical protein